MLSGIPDQSREAVEATDLKDLEESGSLKPAQVHFEKTQGLWNQN